MIRVRPGDLLVSGINAAKGAVAVYSAPDGRSAAATIHYGAYEVDTRRADTNYLWWFMRSAAFRDVLARHLPGGIKTEWKAKRLLAVPIKLPGVSEQRRIVDRIEIIAKKINDARRMRDEAEAEAIAMLAAHLNRQFGDPYRNKPGAVACSRWARLGDVVHDVADGPHVTPTYVEDGVPFITVLNITSGRIDFSKHKYITPQQHSDFQKRSKAERGDVLVSKDGTIGIPCYIDTDQEFSFFVSVALIKPDRSVLDGRFLAWVIRTPYLQERIRQRSRGDMIKHLVLREIRELIVPIPALEEQRRLVQELELIRERIDTLEGHQLQSAREVEHLLLAVLEKAFLGELWVN